MERWLNIPIYSFQCENFPKTKWRPELKSFKPKNNYNRIVLQNYAIVYVEINKMKNKIPFKFELELDYERNYKISFLKSVLQKAIRRQDLYYAITSAKQIYLQDPIQLIRRLIIIMIEDTILVENWFQTLCWMTCQKQFTERQVEWIMGVVYRICLQHKKMKYTGCQSRDLNMSIRLRKKYGGMKCDLNLISSLKTGIYNREHTYIKWDSIPTFEIDPKNRTLKSSIDFHISKVDKYIQDNTEFENEITIATIRRLIWEFRSSYNRRETRINRCFCKDIENCERCRNYKLYRELERNLDKYSYFKLKSFIES